MNIQQTIYKDLGKIFIYFPLRWIIRFVPPLFDIKIFKFMGDLYYCFSRKKRKILTDNLNMAFENIGGDSSLVRLYMENHFVNQYLTFLSGKLNAGNIGKYTSIKGIENIDLALLKGKGCILLHGHFGPAQFPLYALGLKGYPMNQIYRPDEMKGSVVKNISQKIRKKNEDKIPAKMIPITHFLRPAFEVLKKNEIVMMAGDGGSKLVGKFIPCKFFDQSVLFSTGPINLAKKTGAPVLPIFVIRENENRYRYTIVIEKDLNLEFNTDRKEETFNTIKFVKIFEKYVEQYPDEWEFWENLKERLSERPMVF